MSESETASASNMDLVEEFERTIAEMEWEEVESILKEMIMALMGDASTPPNPSSSPPPPPNFHPADPDLSTLPQTEEVNFGAYCGCTPVGAALGIPSVCPGSLQQTHLNSTARAHGQEQRQGPGQEERKSIPVVPHNNPLYPVQLLNGAMLYKVFPVVVPMNICNPVNGEMLCQVLPGVIPLNISNPVHGEMGQVLPAAPLNTCRENQGMGNNVKKRLNAFKLFSKEQRSKVMAELPDKPITAVNRILRQKWKSLSNEDKAEYYQQAEREKQFYEQRHPKQSTTSNCGKERKDMAKEKQSPF